jgi:hypothetical protein
MININLFINLLIEHINTSSLTNQLVEHITN